jgi:hypothetical protein
MSTRIFLGVKTAACQYNMLPNKGGLKAVFRHNIPVDLVDVVAQLGTGKLCSHPRQLRGRGRKINTLNAKISIFCFKNCKLFGKIKKLNCWFLLFFNSKCLLWAAILLITHPGNEETW